MTEYRGSKMAEPHTHKGWGTNLWWNLFWFRSKPSWLYNILDAHASSFGHISFSLWPTQCTWSCFFVACHQRNLCSISSKNTHVLFTWATRCISCNFCSQGLTSAAVWTYQRGSSSQYSTHVPWYFLTLI